MEGVATDKKLELLKMRKSDLSKRNRSLRLLKIYDKWNFDLAQLQQLESVKSLKFTPPKQIVQNLLQGKKITFLFGHQETDELILRFSHKLTTLYRNLNVIEEETGQYNLCVGYPFIKGRFIDGTFIQAPIFLFPVRLDRTTKNGWSLLMDSTEDVTINQALIIAFQKFNRITIDESIYEEGKTLPTEGFEDWVLGLLKEIGIRCEFPNRELLLLTQYNQKDIPDSKLGEFEITPNLVLGHFVLSNSAITKDYDELIELFLAKEDLGLIGDLLLEDAEPEVNNGDLQDTKVELDKVSEAMQYFITDLDASQEEVVLSAEYEKGIVVHGPPGTGKSQVIANLVSQALANNKKVLVVCQKRVALDVVYQRLDAVGLADNLALVHDPDKDRKALFAKIQRAMTRSLDGGYYKVKDKYNHLCEKLDEQTAYFNSVARSLYEVQPCALNAFELYANSKQLTDKDIYVQLEDLPDKLTVHDINKIKSNLLRLGNYYGQFGGENYPWKKRKSFNDLSQSKRYEIRKLIQEILEQIEKTETMKQKSGVKEFKVPNYFLFEDLFQKTADKIVKYNQRGFLSRFLLSWWLRGKGKEALDKSGLRRKVNLKSNEWEEIREGILNCLSYINDLKELAIKLDLLAPYLEPELITHFKESVRKGRMNKGQFQKMLDTITLDFEELVEMDSLIARLNPEELRLLTLLTQTKEFVLHERLGEEWIKSCYQSFYSNWIDKVEALHLELRTVGKYEEVLDDYKSLNAEKKELTPEFLRVKTHERTLQYTQKDKRLKELLHQVGKSRQLWTIRRILKEFSHEGLFDFIPVWLVSPETVSRIFPMERGLFDLVIFDEASQCSVEDGVPCFYRAKQVVIAGDEKQLAPFDLFSVTGEDDGETGEGFEDSESILNLSKRCFPSKLLAWHYRSKYEELINFSNHAFYRGEVQIAPNVLAKADPPSIEWVQANGLWENQTNEIEAKQVVETLKQILKRYPDKSVGIITFNKKQQDKIQNLIEKRQTEDFGFNGLYTNVMARDIDNRPFVKNIENVQGDERDIIIFSIAYGRNVQGRVSVSFGLLSQTGGENRLNVAVSRAKEKTYVVCSLLPNELDVSSAKNEGPKLFKKYLEYAYAVAHHDKQGVEAVFKDVNPNLEVKNSSENNHFDSDFENEVYDEFCKRGYEVRTQVGCSGYRIDMAIINPEDPSRFIIGVECDGAMFHSARSAKERDIYRQRFLESKGWKIIRIWSKNWWQNPTKEVNRIEDEIKNLLCEEKEEKVIPLKRANM